MAPRKTNDEQHEEFRQTLMNFTQGLQEALQIAVENALTTVLQTQQGNRRERRVEFDEEDDEEVVDNLFAIPIRQERDQQLRLRDNNINNNNSNNTPRWESGFRLEIPEFAGGIKAEEFLDWLNVVEEVLDFKKVPDEFRVSLVATRFKGRAMAWWTQLKESRRRSGKAKIESWEKLKKYMRRGFLPYNYERTLYTKLQNLRQGSRTVDEYASDFFEMAARTTLTETEEQLVSRFIGGLRSQLQIPLQQFNPTSVSEAHQRALGMEIQYKNSWNTLSSKQPI
ncbi:Retrotransposon gag domain [Arabidopsis suecica]|uniref:Retrotransposon gag domain n=1 Tax=Arabidopsis suecica TaxID=45249 RepID=A0A8T1ZFQ4_ARASU|nr:Retrotransposon gag domain [Arabidopsis suecica]